MVEQAQPNLRDQTDTLKNGSARRVDVLTADVSFSRAQFSVTSREIDLQIAAADFARAAGLDHVWSETVP